MGRNKNSQKQQNRQSNQSKRTANREIKKRLGSDVNVIEYAIIDGPLEDKWSKRIPSHVRTQLEHISLTIRLHPQQAISELSKLIKNYPKIPVLYNHLSHAYERSGDPSSRDANVLECYKKFPTYLFAQINYAQYCLAKGDPEKIPKIFSNKLDLKLLYPQRTTFHISEYTGFMGMIGLYYVLIGKLDCAKQHYKALKCVAPRHSSTKRLKRVLYPSLLTRFLLWLFKKELQPIVKW